MTKCGDDLAAAIGTTGVVGYFGILMRISYLMTTMLYPRGSSKCRKRMSRPAERRMPHSSMDAFAIDRHVAALLHG